MVCYNGISAWTVLFIHIFFNSKDVLFARIQVRFLNCVVFHQLLPILFVAFLSSLAVRVTTEKNKLDRMCTQIKQSWHESR